MAKDVFLIHGELRAMKVFQVPRRVRRFTEVPGLYEDVQEARVIARRWGEEGVNVAVNVMYLDYLGEPDPPWEDKELVQALVRGVARWPYRGKRENHPALQALYRHFRAKGYTVWYVPFELWSDRPLVLWTPKGAYPL